MLSCAPLHAATLLLTTAWARWVWQGLVCQSRGGRGICQVLRVDLAELATIDPCKPDRSGHGSATRHLPRRGCLQGFCESMLLQTTYNCCSGSMRRCNGVLAKLSGHYALHCWTCLK